MYEVTLKDGSKKRILKNLNGSVHSGEILGIIGPSGSGKSTFLDVLAGRKHKENV